MLNPIDPIAPRGSTRRLPFVCTVAALAVLICCPILATPATPVDAAPAQPPAAAPTPSAVEASERTLRTDDDALETEIRVDNTQAREKKFRLSILSAAHKHNGRPVPALLKALGRAPTSEPVVISVPGHGSARVLLTATLARAGEYEIRVGRETIDENGGAGQLQELVFSTTRESTPIKEDLILPLQPLQLEQRLFFFSDPPRRMLTPLRNTSEKTVEFSKPAITAFQRAGASDIAFGVAEDQELALLAPAGSAPTTRLGPGAATDYVLTVPARLSPGKYSLTILSAGGGVISQRTLEISVRASWVIAFLCFLIGALGGHVVSEWRARGKTVVDQLIRLATMREQLAAIAGDTVPPAAARLVEDLRLRFTDIDERARGGADVATDLATAGDRFGAIRSFVLLLRQSAPIETFQGDARPDRIREIERAFSANPIDAAAMAALLEKFADDIRNAPLLASAAEEAKALARAWRERNDRLDSLKLDGADALRAAIDALDMRRTQPPATETAVERHQKLKESSDALERAADKFAESYRQWIEARAAQSPKKESAEAVVRSLPKPATAKSFDDLLDAAASVEDLSGKEALEAAPLTPLPSGLTSLPIPIQPGPLPLPGNMSLRSLQQYRFWMQTATNLVALGSIGLAGVWALWLNNPTWGGWVDILTAIFAGAGTRLVAGEARPPSPPLNP